MYMSGPPLHVITMNLVQKFRERMRSAIPISFSGGLDAHNIADAVAMNFVPVTTCTDLLRPGGYARLIRYLENLGEKMRDAGRDAHSGFRPELSRAGAGGRRGRGCGGPAQHSDPGRRSHGQSALPLGAQPRRAAQDRLQAVALRLHQLRQVRAGLPQRRQLRLRDAGRRSSSTTISSCCPARCRRVPGGVLRVVKAHQLANYADACNECGNCDIFCPEDGGPHGEKPRFFGSLETYRKYAGRNGFFIDLGRPARRSTAPSTGASYVLTLGPHDGPRVLRDGNSAKSKSA